MLCLADVILFLEMEDYYLIVFRYFGFLTSTDDLIMFKVLPPGDNLIRQEDSDLLKKYLLNCKRNEELTFLRVRSVF